MIFADFHHESIADGFTDGRSIMDLNNEGFKLHNVDVAQPFGISLSAGCPESICPDERRGLSQSSDGGFSRTARLALA
jgi:hypothetical protein